MTDYEENLKYLMSVPQGRSFFWQLLSDIGVFRSTFAGDPYTSAFNEGKRDVGIRIYSDIVSSCPDEYLLMMKEAQQEKEEQNYGTNDRTELG